MGRVEPQKALQSLPRRRGLATPAPPSLQARATVGLLSSGDHLSKPPVWPPPPERAPVPIPEGLIREAEALALELAERAQVTAQNLRYWADPTRRPTCGVVLEPGSNTVESLCTDAEVMVAQLRRAMAILNGAPSAEAQDEAGLLALVNLLVDRLPGLPARTVEFNGEPLDVPAVPPATPEDAIRELLVERPPYYFTAPTLAALQAPKSRALLAQVIALRAGLATGRGRARGKAPRWVEPLFKLALLAGVVVGESTTPHAWYQALRLRGLLTHKRPAK